MAIIIIYCVLYRKKEEDIACLNGKLRSLFGNEQKHRQFVSAYDIIIAPVHFAFCSNILFTSQKKNGNELWSKLPTS